MTAPDTDGHTVGVIAELTGISIRTLHHYDEIGLLEPGRRSTAGYRLYSTDDLRRLQQILFYRELDFDLATIAGILADPTATADDHLHRQRGLLTDRITRHQAMVTAIDRELAAHALGITLSATERLEVFGNTRLEDNADRAADRWGDTAAWQQRRERSATRTKDDWLALRAEQNDIHLRLLDHLRRGVPAADPAVLDIAEEHRRHTQRWFHDCDHDSHRELARAYLANERIGRNYDDMAPGLSRYIHDAIIANSGRAAAGQPAAG
ncbi:MAG TPA: MerR family transcriptional regulator [Pseudonocardiaceae bacterium]